MAKQRPRPPRANGKTNGVTASSSSSGYYVTNVAAGHRANHVTYGHVGRVTYIPAEDDDSSADHHGVGRLSTNRHTDGEASVFSQVTPCREWYPPAALPLQQTLQPDPALADMKPAARSLNWLLQEAPDAVLGVSSANYSPALLRELRASAAAEPPQTRLPLLAQGAITSLEGATPTGCAALATAVGESGHILRISRMRSEDWTWSANGKGPVSFLRSSLVDAAEEGYWCAGATAINQIKFAAQPASAPSSRPNRWLLVQTAQATHVFAPTLHRVPVPSTKKSAAPGTTGAGVCGSAACSCSNLGPSYISPTPLVRIPTEQTGGKPHVDVAFNPPGIGVATSDADEARPQPPQVAIVDHGGTWTVWNLIEVCKPGKKDQVVSLQVVLRARGNISDGVSPRTHWAAAAAGLGNLNRILWLAPAKPTSGSRSATLLLGNATSLHVVETGPSDSDLDTTDKNSHHRLLHTLNITRQDWLDVVLDVQLLPTHPWHVAVLTTTALVWLDLSPQTERRKQGDGLGTPHRSSSSSHHGASRNPVVLLSFPLMRDPTDKTPKLCVTPACSSSGGGDEQGEQQKPCTSLVFVYSMTRPEVSQFWLTSDPTDARREPSYQYQLFPLTLLPLEGSSAEGTGHANERLRWTGAQAMAVLPLSFVSHVQSVQGMHFFQLLALGRDQRVCSALYANAQRLRDQASISATPPQPVVAAEALCQKWDKARHQAAKKTYDDIFVVPDNFSNTLLSSAGAASRRPYVVADVPEQGAAGEVAKYVVPGVYALLHEGLGRATDAARTTASSAMNVDCSPLDIVRQVVERGFVRGTHPFTTLLDAANDMFMADFLADQTVFSWASRLTELGYIEQGRVFIFDQMQGGGPWDDNDPPANVLEAMAGLCVLPAWLREARYRQQHTQLLSYAAVQLYLAQISMVVVPKRLQLQRQAEQAANLPLSRAAAAIKQQPSQVDRFSRLGEPLPAQSSPVAPRHNVPDWLASSQDIASSQPEDGGVDEDGGNDDDDEYPDEDSTIARLRQYAVSIRSEPPFVRDDLVLTNLSSSSKSAPASGGVTINDIRLLSHWVLGTDPDHFHWVPVAGGTAGAAEEAMRLAAIEQQEKKRRRREEKRAQRERERLLMMGAVGAGIGSPRFAAPAAGMSQSSPMPSRILASSQVVPSDSQLLPRQIIPGSSQMASSQALPSQVWPSSSQRTTILTGSLFGTANRPKKKKAKTARGLR